MNYTEDLQLLEEAARKVAPIIMRYFGEELDVERKAHAGFSPVTIADKEADEFLHKFLTSARDDYGWLSEEIEDNAERLGKDYVFIVDPIDGTKPFIKGEPEFAISLAIAHKGEAVVGVVYNPAKDEMFSSALGLGMFFNGEKVSLVEGKKLLASQECLISHSEQRHGIWDVYNGKFSVRAVGSIAYKLALVAAGQSDMTVTLRPKSEWDCAAGHIMCHEVGLKVTDVYGGEIRYNTENPDGVINCMIVCQPYIYDELKETLHDR